MEVEPSLSQIRFGHFVGSYLDTFPLLWKARMRATICRRRVLEVEVVLCRLEVLGGMRHAQMVMDYMLYVLYVLFCMPEAV